MRTSPLLMSTLALSVLMAMHAMADDAGQWPVLSTPASDCTRIDADTVVGTGVSAVTAQGNVHIAEPLRDLHAEYVQYLRDPEHILAKGQVHFHETGLELVAEDLDYVPTTHLGQALHITYITSPSPGPIKLLLDPRSPAPRPRQKSYGSADTVQFLGPQHYQMLGARYTTCGSSKPDWYISAERIDLDYRSNIGQAYNARLHFLGSTIGWLPWIDFPLDGQRKSGFLPPTLASTSSGGVDLTLPYYWNISPNIDSTVSPREIERRGLLFSTQSRYLQQNGSGEFDAEWLAHDQLAHEGRYFFSLNNGYRFGPRVTGGLNLQTVSDAQYFIDFGDQLAAATQVNLPREGWLAYQHGDWKGLAQVQHFQSLPDSNAVATVNAGVTPLSAMPYWRSPQFAVSGRELVHGLDFNFNGEWVNFRHPQLPDGQRLNLYPSLAWPLSTSYAEFTPKIGLMYTRYELEANASDDVCPASVYSLSTACRPTAFTTLPVSPLGQLPVPGETSIQRVLPIFSVNSRVVLERDLSLTGRPYVQTLEPQVYYVYIPYRNQQGIPLFDTADTVFSFSQMFNENRYSGIDRVNDVNQVTVAMTSKFLDQGSGEERFRFALGQRYALTSQRVILQNGDTPQTASESDILALLAVRPNHMLNFETTVDYSQTVSRWQRVHVDANYTPGVGKTLNLGYYFEAGSLRQVDVSGEWPIAPRWYGVARELYSQREGTQLESLAGVEYNAGCWRLRMVFQRYVVSQGVHTTHPFIQLELGGFSGVGSNPLKVLQDSIPGYSPGGRDGNQQ